MLYQLLTTSLWVIYEIIQALHRNAQKKQPVLVTAWAYKHLNWIAGDVCE